MAKKGRKMKKRKRKMVAGRLVKRQRKVGVIDAKPRSRRSRAMLNDFVAQVMNYVPR